MARLKKNISIYHVGTSFVCAILVLAGQRGVSRPAYGATRVGASINDTSTPGTIGGGNPLLKPEYTWGLDTSVEWYLPGGACRRVKRANGFKR